jgi:hypothetical protein
MEWVLIRLGNARARIFSGRRRDEFWIDKGAINTGA